MNKATINKRIAENNSDIKKTILGLIIGVPLCGLSLLAFAIFLT